VAVGRTPRNLDTDGGCSSGLADRSILFMRARRRLAGAWRTVKEAGPTGPRRARSAGQGIAEFAIVIPLFMTLILGVLEGGVAMAVNIGINRAAQSAAHMASMAGNIDGADCLVLDEVEKSALPPTHKDRIQSVVVQLTDLSGDYVLASNTWNRSGATTCVVADDLTLVVPYGKISESYPDTQRCNVLSGCPTMTPVRSTVDNIGVIVTYHHDWITPLGSAIPFPGSEAGWTFSQRNIFRMEPHR
jgi:hypothetical protein